MAEFDFAAFADRLMAAGDQLAEQLRNPRSRADSPWTLQILDEWREAKDVRGYLPEPRRVASMADLDMRPFNMQDGPPIPWFLAEIIHRNVYRSDQSVQRLHERGGFTWSEVAFMCSRKWAKPEHSKACRDEAWTVMQSAAASDEQGERDA